MVKEVLTTLPKYQAANNEVNQAKHAVDVLTGNMTYLDHYRRALEGAVTLHGQGYFAAPRLKQSTSDDVRRRLSDGSVNASLRRKRKKKRT